MQKPEYFDQVVKLFSEGLLQKEIAQVLEIKPQALAWQMKKFGFSFQRTSYTLSDEQIEELISRYKGGESVPSICKDLPCSDDTAIRFLNINGIKIRSKKELKFYKGYEIDENAFSDPSEEGCSYFYGWILTDGCLTKRSVSIELSSKDEELLFNLKEYLKSSNGIRRRSRTDNRTGNTYHQSSFAFSHDSILERLINFGLESRKSLNERAPEVFKFNSHFWRGVIEGDGHIAKNSNGVELCGGPELVSAFANYCESVYPNCPVKFSKNGKMDVVRVRSREACKAILDSIYLDCSLKLSRKYKTYMDKYYGTDPD